MKRINTSAIPAGLGAPVKTGTLEFIFDSHKETVASVIKGALQGGYVVNTPYILWGCDLGSSASHATNTAGAIFMNDEVFLIDAGTSPTVGAWDGMKIVTTNYTTNADPVTFSDGSTTGSIHNIRKMAMQQGGSPPYGMPKNSPYKVGYSTSSSASITLPFDEPKVIEMTHAAGTITITVSASNAINGLTQRLYFSATGSWDFNFVVSSGSLVSIGGGIFTGGNFVVDITYYNNGGTPQFIALFS